MKTTELCLIASILWVAGCHSDTPRIERESTAASTWLTDVTEASGVTFTRDGGAEDSFEMPQIMGSGGGLFDYDGDGDLDLFLVGGSPSASKSAEPIVSSRLFRQESTGRFTDVTMESGLINDGSGMGMAVGDIDNDGDLDVFFSNVDDDRFFLNQGNGTFVDRTALAGVSDPKWSTACSFVDYDRDGWLDLIVVNYVDYFPGSHCYDRSSRRDFCGPHAFKGTVDRLYRNRGLAAEAGGNLFDDVTVSSGLASAAGRGLGVICADFNDDDLPDIFVANDMEPNHLWIQQDDGTFLEEAVIRGVAVNQMGQPEANMGVVYDDLDDDGVLDIFVTHLRGESNTLWKGDPGGIFRDITPKTGLGPFSIPMTGFGVAAVDLNQDARMDLLVVNGHVKRPGEFESKSPVAANFWGSYSQPSQVFLQTSRGEYRNDFSHSGSFISTSSVSRGLISGDFDNDGDVDFVVTPASGPVRLYRNEAPRTGGWLQLRVIDPLKHRDAYGARVTVEALGRKWTRFVQPSTGYLTHQDPRLNYGLADANEFDRILVRWPDGRRDAIEEFDGGPVNQSLIIQRGSGRIVHGDR